MIGYIDFDWGGSQTDGTSTIGGCFCLGPSMISWMSRKKESVSFISADVEYIATYEVRREVVWLRKLLSNLFEGLMDPTVIHFDNQLYKVV